MKWFELTLGCVLAVTLISPTAQAQEEDEECRCGRRWRVEVLPFGESQTVWTARRARLGVLVNTAGNPETDRYGALINMVTQGGPADEAGIAAGDIVTKLNGESLLSGGGLYDQDESAPGMRLIERAGMLESGDTVEIEYRRDGKTQTVELVAGDAGLGYFPLSLEAPMRVRELVGRLRELPELTFRGPESFAVRLGARFPGLELVSLNADLGEYFGADEGVLVVSVPEESDLSLRSGDVIMAIDGRQVSSPSHAMRILRSYDADEEVSFQVRRKQSTTTVTGMVPQGLGRGLHTDFERHEN